LRPEIQHSDVLLNVVEVFILSECVLVECAKGVTNLLVGFDFLLGVLGLIREKFRQNWLYQPVGETDVLVREYLMVSFTDPFMTAELNDVQVFEVGLIFDE
jgi:hypothetical protein